MVPNRRILEVVDIDGRRVTKARRRREKRKRRINMGEPTPKLKLSLSPGFVKSGGGDGFLGLGPLLRLEHLVVLPPLFVSSTEHLHKFGST